MENKENQENQQALAVRQPQQQVPQQMAGFSALAMFFDSAQFDTVQRVAKMLCMSDMVPKEYQYKPVNFVNPDGTVNEYLKQQNDAALSRAMANCIIALNKAATLHTDPMTIMQNMGLVYGRPSWAASFVIGAINGCGRFTMLKFKFGVDGHVKENYKEYKKDGGGVNKTLDMPNHTCYAYATEKATGDLIEGTVVSIRMAFDERWVQKDGSKWITMPQQMLMYRAASFFGRTYAPDVMQGMYTREESEDIALAEDANVIDTKINQPRTKVEFEEPKQLEAPAPQTEQPEEAPVEQPTEEKQKTEEAPY